MDLIRQIQKDGGNWYNYDVTFRRIKERDDTLPWSQVDQILYSRSLFKKTNSVRVVICEIFISSIGSRPGDREMKENNFFFGRGYEHRPTARGRFTHILGVRVMLIVEDPTVNVKYRTAIKALFFTLICVLNVKWASFMFINIHILSY